MAEFKVGDVVYDDTLFPGDKGVVTTSAKNISVRVRFEHGGSALYCSDGNYFLNSIPTLKHHRYKVNFEINLPPIGTEGLFWDDIGGMLAFGVLAPHTKDDLTGKIIYYMAGGFGYDNFKPMSKEEFNNILK